MLLRTLALLVSLIMQLCMPLFRNKEKLLYVFVFKRILKYSILLYKTCGQYWPNEGRITCGLFTLELLTVDRFENTIERRVRVSKTCSKVGLQMFFFIIQGLCQIFQVVL